MSKKIGRNEKCPCGSSKKYKHCCGSHTKRALARSTRELPIEVRRAFAEQQAKHHRRVQQQGLGKPIVSAQFADHRMVAVGNTIHWSKSWKTFHDFLFDYIKEIFGRDWGAKEQAKPLNERHILLRWAHSIGEYQKAQRALTPNAAVLTSHSTPILTAYLGLSYNLYLMKHNAKLQQALVARLKASDESSFHGAYYETFVAAAFIKAGYDIDFENEQDGSATHCEFVASPKNAKRKFSVEAKSRFRQNSSTQIDPSKLKLGVRDKLEAALQKKANHTRVVFIDVNMPENHEEGEVPYWIEPALSEIRDLESTMITSGQDTPIAYVFVTNQPYQYDVPGGFSAVMEGFNIAEFKLNFQFSGLRDALEARERHADIHAGFESMQKHRHIPSTFDGEMPNTHFNSDAQPNAELKVGNRYLVPDENGVEWPAELEQAAVLEPEKNAYGIYRLDDGRRFTAVTPLSDAEMEDYRRHPETFFGVIDHNAGRVCRDIMDWYDFFYETYSKAPKEKLLEFMKNSSDIAKLKDLPQAELAKIYCERLATNVFNEAQKP